MRKIGWLICCGIGLAAPIMAQTNGNGPAELPPSSFEGREFVDSQGCAFLRSTFGTEVTWIPRFGPDRQPVCDAEPTTFAQDDTPAAPVPVETATPRPTVAPVAQPAPVPAPRRTAAAQPRRAAAPSLPRADASGRHPNCPASAPYGQLVDTTLGRPLVRCVTSPALFLAPVHNGAVHDPHAPIALPDGSPARQTSHAAPARGSSFVQVGSFAVPGNATRLRARLQQAGMPAQIYPSRGLHVVTVGPFASGTGAQSALSTVRYMGFSDAFLRR